jgi:hypothetical protein
MLLSVGTKRRKEGRERGRPGQRGRGGGEIGGENKRGGGEEDEGMREEEELPHSLFPSHMFCRGRRVGLERGKEGQEEEQNGPPLLSGSPQQFWKAVGTDGDGKVREEELDGEGEGGDYED